MCRFHIKMFLSLDRFHFMAQDGITPSPPNSRVSVTEDGLTAETGCWNNGFIKRVGQVIVLKIHFQPI